MKGVYKTIAIFLFLFCITSSAWAVQWEEVWFFDMVNGFPCTVENANSGRTDASALPEGCSISGPGVCIDENMGSVTVVCGEWPSEFEGSVTGSVSLVNVSLNGIRAAANAAYNTWFESTGNPSCPEGSSSGEISTGYIKQELTGDTPGTVNLKLAMYKRANCTANGATGTALRPINDLFVGAGSGGGSTDMTATNVLLTSIQTNTAGLVSPGGINVNVVSGGGGSYTNMTPTNDLISTGNTSLAGIKDALTGESTLPAVGDPPVVEPYKNISLLDRLPLSDDYKAEFNSFKTDMQATDLYSLMNSFFHPNQGGGSALYSFNAGQFGNHSYDFSSWGGVMSLLRGLTLVAFAATSMRVIFLKG